MKKMFFEAMASTWEVNNFFFLPPATTCRTFSFLQVVTYDTFPENNTTLRNQLTFSTIKRLEHATTAWPCAVVQSNTNSEA